MTSVFWQEVTLRVRVFQNSTSGSVSFLCFHFTAALWKFEMKFSILEVGILLETDCSSAEGRALGWSGIVTGSLCISLGDLVGRNLERIVLGHGAALSQQRAWNLECQSGNRGKAEQHLSAGVMMHKLEQKAGCSQKAWEGSDRKPCHPQWFWIWINGFGLLLQACN